MRKVGEGAPVEYRGVTYPSRAAMCREHGVVEHNGVRAVVWTLAKGGDVESALRRGLEITRKLMGREDFKTLMRQVRDKHGEGPWNSFL